MTLKNFNLRFFLRELIGLYRYLKAKKVYSLKNHPVNISDNSPNSRQLNNESFESFFMRIEKLRNYSSNRIAKNVDSSITYFITASKFIPFLINTCKLKKDFKVLDYGSGGLRCGFGLIDFLDESSYACADISERFLFEAKNNSFLLSQLFEYKKANFFKIGEDKIPLRYYDLIISTYVVPHIPKYKLNDYFSSINKYLKDDGIFYFDFMPSPVCLMQNLTTFTYPYNLITDELNQAGLKIIKTAGSGVFVKKI